MTGLFEIARVVLLYVRLFSCPDAPGDEGGVRCASTVAAELTPPWRDGEAEGGAFLRRVAVLESESRPVGVHAGDAGLGRAMWAASVRAGWLRPDACPGHRLDADGRRGRGWGPRSSWGASAAYTIQWVGFAGCVLGPAVLDVPAFGAIAAAGHAKRCARARRTRDPGVLRTCWAGKRKPAADVLRRWRGGRAEGLG